jgi:hypothetical protein
MELLFGLFIFCVIVAFADEVHEKWHEREMAKYD